MESMSLISETLMRKKLDGKTATAGDFAQRVTRLMTGDSLKNIEPMGVSEVMRKLGFKDRNSVYRLRDLAIEMNLLKLDEEGNPILPQKSKDFVFKNFDTNHPFVVDPLVSEWKRDLLTRKRGSPVASWQSRLRHFEAVCNTLKANPEQFITGNNILEILSQAREFLKNFMEAYKRGEAKIRYRGELHPENDFDAVRYSYAYAIRDFMRFHGFAFPKGETGIMSVSITQFHGIYADVRLTDEELEQADIYIKDTWGMDSDIFRAFWIGIESCARSSALWGMTTDYTTHISDKTGKITYIMTVYESKTKQIKGGKWTKYIRREETQKSIDLVKSRGGFIYENHDSKQATTEELKIQLKQIFKHIGKEYQHLKFPNDKTSGYYMNHPFHALRHIGAHYWLSKKQYNFGLVAKLGGWNTIDELKNSYGEMPPEIVLSLLEDEEKA